MDELTERALDAAVHTAVTGNATEEIGGPKFPMLMDAETRLRVPEYHRDDAALWAVVDALKADGWWPRLRPVWMGTATRCEVAWEFELERDGFVREAMHEDRRTAICRAICEALGGNDE